MSETEDRRPDCHPYTTGARRELAVISIRTCFSYRMGCDGTAPEGRVQVAQYRSEVTDFGEFDTQPIGYRTVGDVFQRMIREFGDEAELEVVIRRRSEACGDTSRPKPVQMRGITNMTDMMERSSQGATPGGVTGGVPDSFAARLNRLFATVYPPGRGPYIGQELVRALSTRGPGLSAPYLSQLRTGERKRPSEQTIELIAEFFGIRSEYFTDPESGYAQWLDSELEWLDLAHNPDVQQLTTMLTDLDAGTRERLMADAGI